MKETEKLLKNYPEIKALIRGEVLDIGCGNSPVTENCTRFDRKDGDANFITRYIRDKTFDVVFSSHCLEHMWNPYRTIREWYELVREGGYLIVAVPDEDLYEQGVFPSRWNRGHKWTFALDKKDSWSLRSVNLKDLADLLGGEIVSLRKQDDFYDYGLHDTDQTVGEAMAQDLLIVRKAMSSVRKNEVK